MGRWGGGRVGGWEGGWVDAMHLNRCAMSDRLLWRHHTVRLLAVEVLPKQLAHACHACRSADEHDLVDVRRRHLDLCENLPNGLERALIQSMSGTFKVRSCHHEWRRILPSHRETELHGGANVAIVKVARAVAFVVHLNLRKR